MSKMLSFFASAGNHLCGGIHRDPCADSSETGESGEHGHLCGLYGARHCRRPGLAPSGYRPVPPSGDHGIRPGFLDCGSALPGIQTAHRLGPDHPLLPGGLRHDRRPGFSRVPLAGASPAGRRRWECHPGFGRVSFRNLDRSSISKRRI